MDPRLRTLLTRDYVGFSEPDTGYGSWLMPPTATVTVIVNVGEPFGGLPGAFIAGIEDGYSVVARAGTISCLDVKLTPLGAYRLVGMPMSELRGQVVALADAFGGAGRRLTEALVECAAWEARYRLLDQFLIDRAATGPEPSPEVARVWRRLVDSGGGTPVGGLAAEVGWSRRHLTAMFTRQVGLPPKTVARLVRFGRLLGALPDGGGPVRWDRIAVECGYYDQAHLNRDFRQFTGTTPTDFLARRRPGGSIVGDGVASVQDSSAPAA
jgi:AraC-like DNA-binding protein